MAVATNTIASRLMVGARLRHIQVLVKVAELGSVVRAAQVLGMTQPSASHIVADLENLLGCTLFQRHARGMTPTPVALALIPYARRMLDSVFNCAEVASAMANSARTVLRIAAITSAVSGVLTHTLPAFSQKHLDILVNALETDKYEIGELIAQSAIDLALCREPAMLREGWSFFPLLEDSYIIAAGPQHPLAETQQITLSMLFEETWILVPAPSDPKQAFDELLKSADSMPRTKIVATRSQMIISAFLQQERLITVLPKSMVRHALDRKQLVQLPITLPLRCEPLGILAPKLDRDSAASRFVSFLQEYFAVA